MFWYCGCDSVIQKCSLVVTVIGGPERLCERFLHGGSAFLAITIEVAEVGGCECSASLHQRPRSGGARGRSGEGALEFTS